MRNLLKILLVSGILLSSSTSLNAKEIYLSQQTTKDYRVHVKVYDDLKIGDNELNIKILYKTKALTGVNINFKLYKPNGEIVEYKSNTVNDKNNYTFNINLTEKGEYSYVTTYNVMTGGVTRDARGSFKL
ncbi:MAG: FixH family protein [Aliarcobacter sp.]|nr:FixH family protein [Aliarcobacter sp.]